MNKPWQGSASPRDLSETDFQRAASRLRCEVAVIKAVWEVEAAGRHFLKDGSVIRRFEPHHFPKDLWPAIGFAPRSGEAAWRASVRLSSEAMFQRAAAIDLDAAIDASSWGAPQIMAGMNHKAAGFSSGRAMVESMAESAANQLDAFVNLVESWGIAASLRNKDWRAFTRRYNGSGQVEHYSALIARAYARHAAVAPIVLEQENIFRDDFMPEPSAPAPAPRQQAVPTLRIGSKGEAVRAWQQRLRDLRYFSGKIDGDFGSRTHGATMEFQADHGLVQDGIVGPQTRAAEANAVPRALRDVSKEEVAAESRTIKEAEKGKQRIAVAGVLAGLPTAVSQIEEITEVINQARSLTDLMSGLAPMTLAILGIGAAVFFGFRAFNKIEGYRIEDAQTGANDRI